MGFYKNTKASAVQGSSGDSFTDRMRVLQRVRGELATARNRVEYSEKAAKLIPVILKQTRYNFLTLSPLMYPDMIPDPNSSRTLPLSFAEQEASVGVCDWRVGGMAVWRGSRQTGKTTAASALIDTCCHLIPEFRAIYIAPRPDQVKTFADQFARIAENNSLSKGQNRKGLKINVYSRQYPQGGYVRMLNILTHANSVRGLSVDMLYLDEAQGFDGDLFADLIQITRQSLRWQTFFLGGTAMGTDSFLEEMYQHTSKGTHHVICPHCNFDNDTGNDAEQVLKMIRPRGVSCQRCGGLLDVREAFIVHQHPDRIAEQQFGVHVPQIIIPRIAQSEIRWNNIYLDFLRMDHSKITQEYLGIPVEDSTRELTRKNLQDICTLRRAFVQSPANLRTYRFIISGLDWGGSDKNVTLRLRPSKTAHVMIGVRSNGTLEIIHMKDYSGMGYESIIKDIVFHHDKFKGTHLCADEGMGDFYNNQLFKQFYGKVFVIRYSGITRTALCRIPGGPEETWTAHKTETLSTLFDMVRSGRLLCYEWQYAEPHLGQFLNITRAPQELPSGATVISYRLVGNKNNDIAMACNYGRLGMHILTGEEVIDHEISRQRQARQTAYHEALILKDQRWQDAKYMQEHSQQW